MLVAGLSSGRRLTPIRRSRICVQSRLRLMARARHVDRGHVAARSGAAQSRGRRGALDARRRAAGVGERGGRAAGERAGASGCRPRMRDWDKKQPGTARFRRISNASRQSSMPPACHASKRRIAAAEQRDQREQAAFHLESGRRLFQAERDAEAIAELRRAIYLSPYEREAHLLLGRVYLRGGQRRGRDRRAEDFDLERRSRRRAAGARRGVHPGEERRCRAKRAANRADARALERRGEAPARHPARRALVAVLRVGQQNGDTQPVAC